MDLNEEEFNFILQSERFDCEWYKNKYRLSNEINPIIHYLIEGAEKGYNPNNFFDTKWYLNEYEDVRRANINPFFHYLKNGINENRKPKKLNLDDVKTWAFNLIEDDYFSILKSDLFDCKGYLKKYSLPSSINPIIHYLIEGAEKGYNPNNFFDTKWYLNEYGDVKKSKINPFVHYIRNGFYECRITKLTSLNELKNQNLKLSFKGRFGWIFLINDTNNEIKQHYDETFNNFFNASLFEKNLKYKKWIFNKNNIKYFYLLVPDKSVVCSNLLPFKYKIFKRNITKIKDFIDYAQYLNYTHYFKYDSHLNYGGGKILAFYLLNLLDKEITRDVYEEIISKSPKISVNKIFDLVSSKNWSYSNDEKKFIPSSSLESVICGKKVKLYNNEIPEKFKYCGGRKSHYFKNESGWHDLKLLILHDSSAESIFWYLTPFFKEILLYWDHGSIDKDLISLFNPDLIIEIRIERFIDNMITASWINNQEELE